MRSTEAECAHDRALTSGRPVATAAHPLLLVGDTDRDEFRAAAAWLAEHGATAVSDVQAALRLVEHEFAPALLILAIAWPGAFSDQQLAKLRHAAPLARIVALLGTWTEGETRSGRPLPGVQRVYWYEWARLASEIKKLQTEGCVAGSSLALPATARHEDRWLSTAKNQPNDPAHSAMERAAPQSTERTVGIVAKSREAARSLADVCGQSGWQTRWLWEAPIEVPSIVQAVLFDSINGSAAEIALVARLHDQYREVPIVVVQGFPRTGDVERWQQAGAAAVVAKPFLAADLRAAVEAAVQVAGSRSAARRG